MVYREKVNYEIHIDLNKIQEGKENRTGESEGKEMKESRKGSAFVGY